MVSLWYSRPFCQDPYLKVDIGTAIVGVSRTVTLPDYQGLGLAHIMVDTIGGMFAHQGKRTNSYPSHPSLIRSRSTNPNWRLIKSSGTFNSKSKSKKMGAARANAVYSYVGPKLDIQL